jgi:hypothetical protein
MVPESSLGRTIAERSASRSGDVCVRLGAEHARMYAPTFTRLGWPIKYDKRATRAEFSAYRR